MRLIETHAFTRRVTAAMSDDEYRMLQQVLLRRPAQGDVIAGTGGVRKVRWREAGRGKRGALRIISDRHADREIFLMLFLYHKNEQTTSPPSNDICWETWSGRSSNEGQRLR